MLIRYRVYSGLMVLKQQQQKTKQQNTKKPNPTKQTDKSTKMKWSSERELSMTPLPLLPSSPKTPKFPNITVAFWAPAYTGGMTSPCHSTEVYTK